MEKIFRDENLNVNLSQDGYVTFDCLSNTQVQRLLGLYKKEKPLFWRKPVYCNAFVDNEKKNRRIDSSIVKTILENDIMNEIDYGISGGCFIVKKKGKENEVGLHQDWNITDETVNQSYVIWIPLVDTTIKNGALVVLPKSNLKFKETIRSNSFDSLYIPVNDMIEGKGKIINLKAGQGIVYSSALFHGSFKNKDAADRIAIVASIVDKSVQKHYYHYDDSEDKLYKLNMPEDFYLTYQRKLGKIKIQDELEILETSNGHPKILSAQEVLSQ